MGNCDGSCTQTKRLEGNFVRQIIKMTVGEDHNEWTELCEIKLLLDGYASWDSVSCLCTRVTLHDEEMLKRGMKGKVIEDTVDVKISDIDKKNKRKVSFDTEALEEKNDMDKIMEENFPNQEESSDDMKNANVKGKVVVVEQLYSEPVEDFDIAYKEDLVKMKELGLPLGFLNVSPYDVDASNGLIEVPQK